MGETDDCQCGTLPRPLSVGSRETEALLGQQTVSCMVGQGIKLEFSRLKSWARRALGYTGELQLQPSHLKTPLGQAPTTGAKRRGRDKAQGGGDQPYQVRARTQGFQESEPEKGGDPGDYAPLLKQ